MVNWLAGFLNHQQYVKLESIKFFPMILLGFKWPLIFKQWTPSSIWLIKGSQLEEAGTWNDRFWVFVGLGGLEVWGTHEWLTVGVSWVTLACCTAANGHSCLGKLRCPLEDQWLEPMHFLRKNRPFIFRGHSFVFYKARSPKYPRKSVEFLGLKSCCCTWLGEKVYDHRGILVSNVQKILATWKNPKPSFLVVITL